MKLTSIDVKNLRNFFFGIGTIVIILYNIRHISYLKAPSILLDEFGYWSVGAALAGKDWSGIASALCPYYSYGYGLILALIIKLSHNISIAYQIAILLNGLFVCMCFYLSYFIFIKLLPDMNRNYIALGSLLINFYPNVIYQTQNAWTETLLMFTFWLSVYIFIHILEKPNKVNLIFFALILGYMLMIHLRSLGILCIGVVLMCALKYLRKITLKEFIIFISTLSIVLVIYLILKAYFDFVLWNNSSLNLYADNTEINDLHKVTDFSGQIYKIKALFSYTGIRFFVMSVLGKFYYMGLSTMFLGYEGLLYLIKSFKIAILNISKQTKEKLSIQNILHLYLLGAYISTLFISAIYMLYPGRIDTVIYGRYTDWLIGPIVLYGFLNMISNTKIKKHFMIYTIFILVYTLCFWDYIKEFGLNIYFASCAPIGWNFYDRLGGDVSWVLYMTCIMITLAVLNLFLTNSKRKTATIIKISTTILVTWIVITTPLMNKSLEWNLAERMSKLTNIVMNERKNKELVYYIYDSPVNQNENIYIGEVQFLLDDITIRCVSKEKIKKLKNVILIFPSQFEIQKSGLKNYNIIYEEPIYKVAKLY